MIDITAIIATYNRHNLLKKCLNSLTSQSFKNFEIIIVDDGSKDNTKNIVSSFSKKLNITYIYQENQGPAIARNAGLKNAKGRIIAFTDDDCIVSQNWLMEINRAFKNKSVSGVEGLTKPKGKIGPFTQYIQNIEGKKYVTCNIAYKKEDIKKGFDTKYPYHFREDADIAYFLIKNNKKIEFNKNVIVYHPAEKINLKSVLKKKKYFISDIYLFKKYPDLYKKYIKFPFEMFTPFYILFSLLSMANCYFIVLLFLTELAELFYRKWHVNFIEFFKFFFLQIIGSFIIFLSIIKGLVRYKVNPLRLLFKS